MRLRCVEQYSPNATIPQQAPRQPTPTQNQIPYSYSTASNSGSRLNYIDKQVAYTATNTDLSTPSQDGSRISWQRPSVLFRSTSKGNSRLVSNDQQTGQFEKLNYSTDNIVNVNADNYTMNMSNNNMRHIMTKNNIQPTHTHNNQLPQSRMSSFSFSNGYMSSNPYANTNTNTNYYEQSPQASISQPPASHHQLLSQLQSRTQQLQTKNTELQNKNNQIFILEQQYKQKQQQIRTMQQNIAYEITNSSHNSSLGTYPTLLEQADRMRKQLVVKNQELQRIRSRKDKQIQELYQLRYMIKNFQKRINTLQQKLHQSYNTISSMNGSISKLSQYQTQNRYLKQQIRQYEQRNRKIHQQNKKLNSMLQFQQGISEQSIRVSSEQNSLYYPFDKYHENTMSLQKQQLEKDLSFHRNRDNNTNKSNNKNKNKIKQLQLQQRQRIIMQKQKQIQARIAQQHRIKQQAIQQQKQQQIDRQLTKIKQQTMQKNQKSSQYQQEQSIYQRQRKIQLELLQHKLKIIEKQNKQLENQQMYLLNRSKSYNNRTLSKVSSGKRLLGQQSSAYHHFNCNYNNEMGNMNSSNVQPQLYMLDQVQRNPYQLSQSPLYQNKQAYPNCQGHSIPIPAYGTITTKFNLQDKSVIDRLNQFEELHDQISAFRRQHYSDVSNTGNNGNNKSAYYL